jgi:hypothetical protein
MFPLRSIFPTHTTRITLEENAALIATNELACYQSGTGPTYAQVKSCSRLRSFLAAPSPCPESCIFRAEVSLGDSEDDIFCSHVNAMFACLVSHVARGNFLGITRFVTRSR